MRYYIIAGEASGDLHGSNLIKELKKLDAGADIRCWGGDLMQQAGAALVKHYKEHAFMGFTEVVMNLGTIMNNLKFCKEDIQQFQPDVLVLIDYPGFNLRIAEWAKQQIYQAYKIVFYISPQVWAWKEGRVKKMRQNIDKMLVILPFEKSYYKNKWHWDVEYVGHPLVEVIDEYKSNQNLQPLRLNFPTLTSNIIALLPGSRKQEILKKLPIMLEVSRSFPQYQFVVAKAPGQEDNFYEPMLQPYTNVSSVRNNTYNLLLHAKAALVTSGTATLETALFGVPEVVCYKGSNISYQIAKRLIKVKYIALVNLIMEKPVVKELIQNDLNLKNLERELFTILSDEKRIAEIKNDYSVLKKLLSEGGNASANAAKSIFTFVAKEWIA
ncbi:MAG TPA: lipid-A-disaccharide synthase [Chitinophagaceae bacterium]|nr:lipid-A-disaccharide synthase [Chitinophagaceae bacterium]